MVINDSSQISVPRGVDVVRANFLSYLEKMADQARPLLQANGGTVEVKLLADETFELVQTLPTAMDITIRYTLSGDSSHTDVVFNVEFNYKIAVTRELYERAKNNPQIQEAVKAQEREFVRAVVEHVDHQLGGAELA